MREFYNIRNLSQWSAWSLFRKVNARSKHKRLLFKRFAMKRLISKVAIKRISR